MKSPFPGMDPYVEPHWLDIHTSMVSGARDLLNGSLPDDLIASAEERIAVEAEDGQQRQFGPDLRLFELPATDEPTGGGVMVATDVYRLLAQAEPITERFIRVIEVGTERLITVIEFVSPTNKSKAGLYAFRAKRAELVSAGVNFVEIDLVRGGDGLALLRPHQCPKVAISPYRVTFRLPTDPAAVQLRPVGLRERLPEIVIPLRQKDAPVTLDLQELVDRAYVNGRYARRIDYGQPLAGPALDADDATWAAELLRSMNKS